MNPIKLSDKLLELLEATLRFTYFCGDVTRIEPPHSTSWRTMSEALCAVISAAGNRLEIDGEPPHLLQAGEALLVPPGVRHCASFPAAGPPYFSRWAHFQVTVFNQVDAFRFLTPPRVWHGTTAAEMGRICEELAALQPRPAAGTGNPLALLARRKYLGLKLFTLIAESSRPHENAGRLLDALQRLAPVLDQLDTAAPETPLRLAAMARLACLSPSRFSALFRDALGVPPAAYQRQQRLNRAKSQLVHTDKPVAQIAREAGFPDPFHFSKAFKQADGLSPRAYRAHLRQGMW
ncbi:MAG: helix-turn-helix domain-containing protein [Lentisphaeria bacterium]